MLYPATQYFYINCEGVVPHYPVPVYTFISTVRVLYPTTQYQSILLYQLWGCCTPLTSTSLYFYINCEGVVPHYPVPVYTFISTVRVLYPTTQYQSILLYQLWGCCTPLPSTSLYFYINCEGVVPHYPVPVYTFISTVRVLYPATQYQSILLYQLWGCCTPLPSTSLYLYINCEGVVPHYPVPVYTFISTVRVLYPTTQYQSILLYQLWGCCTPLPSTSLYFLYQLWGCCTPLPSTSLYLYINCEGVVPHYPVPVYTFISTVRVLYPTTQYQSILLYQLWGCCTPLPSTSLYFYINCEGVVPHYPVPVYTFISTVRVLYPTTQYQSILLYQLWGCCTPLPSTSLYFYIICFWTCSCNAPIYCGLG